VVRVLDGPDVLGFVALAAGADVELDLTPGALEKTNDPVRMYLREMGTVPLLTRDGEVEIAKRIERGQLKVLKSLSRSPVIVMEIISLGDQLMNDPSIIKDLIQFSDEELTDEDRAAIQAGIDSLAR